MAKQIAIQAKGLSKYYKLYSQPLDRVKESLNFFGKKYHSEFHAVNKLSFTVHKGETIGIIGRNGSGKSTLLKMVTRVLTPSSGRLVVHGSISAILELGAGFNPEMSGIENIYLNASINGLSKKETDQRVEEIVAFSELGQFIDQPIKTYSSGMKARLGFAVAINVDPDILIIDEALSVGDAAFRRKCFAKMEEIRARGATILFVSHSEGSIVRLCNRALWLNNGELVLDGPPKIVTGIYLKYSNATDIDKEKILAEYYQLLDSNNDAGDNAVPQQLSDTRNNIASKKTVVAQAKEKTDNNGEFYDPSLKAKSTICYQEHGAKISDVSVTTLNGKKVNGLIHGKKYIFQYTVTPEQALTNVQFGFLIKSIDGVELGGGAFPGKNSYIDLLTTQKTIKIIFHCIMNNGDYFLNAGLIAKIGDKLDYAHRIVDAYMIKVIHTNPIATTQINFIDDITID